MGIRLASGQYVARGTPVYLNDQDRFTCACWVVLDTVDSTKKQYVWSHRGVTNQISLRKLEGASPVFRFSVTSGAINKFVDSTTVAVVGTAYHVAVTWQANVAMAIYVNGVLEASLSLVATQTANYDSGDDNTPIIWGSRNGSSDYLIGAIEGWQFFDRQVLSAAQIKCLWNHGWPHLAATQPGELHFFDGRLLTAFPDLSGQGRHVSLPTEIVGPPVDAGTIGRWDNEDLGGVEGRKIAVAAGGALPGPWTIYGTEPLHPASSQVLSGLTNGTTYEVVVVAVNDAGESPEQSVPATVTPNDAVIRHTPKKLFVG